MPLIQTFTARSAERLVSADGERAADGAGSAAGGSGPVGLDKTWFQPELAIPVLIEALEIFGEDTTEQERLKIMVIGALPRVRATEAVPKLEALYRTRGKKNDLLGISLAWALEKLTGKKYGESYDPWMQGITNSSPP